MFSRLSEIPAPSPSPLKPDSASVSPSVSSPGRQLQFELQQAVERDMVSTRSQDHTPVGGRDDDTTKTNGNSSVQIGKRKAQIDADALTPSAPASKRRRATESPKSDLAPTSKVSKLECVRIEVLNTPEEPIEQTKEQTTDAVVPPTETTVLITPALTPLPQSSPHKPQTLDDEEVTTSASPNLRQESPVEETVDATVDKDDVKATSPRPTKRKKKTPANSPNDKVEDVENPEKEYEHGDPNKEKASTSQTKPPKSTHKRFDSEEPDQPPASKILEPINPETTVHDSPNESSDDDALETVTASAGQTQARLAAQEEAKATAALRKEKKLKRQERDLRLKEQAKAAKKSSKAKTEPSTAWSKLEATVTDVLDENDDPTPLPSPHSSRKSKPPLPALLPDHILAEEPASRPPPLPPPITKPLHKLKLLDLKEKPPRDVRKGNVKVRVLPDDKGVLPPKASTTGKALREAWLMGRRKGGGVERRAFAKGGFVRK